MATDTQKSESQNSEVENPKKTLTLTTPNLNEVPEDFSPTKDNQPEPQSQSQSQTEGGVKEDADGSKPKTTVVSPRGDGGAVNDIQKKLRRAERFGVPVQLSEEEKRNSRAERFGTNTASEASKTSEELKRKARAERFGLSVPASADKEAKKKARLARFGSDVKVDSQEEEKRKARAIRFSQSSNNAVSEVNGKGNVELKTAVAGNSGGGA